jgi:DNA gyrase/topoisomerase IV subunit B
LQEENGELAEKAKKMSELNDEMRVLVTQEREVYNDDQTKYEEGLEYMRKAMESKQKLIKNRLLMALGATDNMTLDDAVKMACDILHKYRANLMTLPKQQINTLISD